MLEKFNHYPVNWIDGMKINKSHFIAMQDNVSEVVRDSIGTQLNAINYGLLPIGNTGESAKISLIIDNHKLLRVKVEECHAVTPNGCRIEISSKSTPTLNLEMPYPEAVYELKEGEEVVLLANITVNLFNKQSFGEPDPDENPPRSPFVFPTYNLNLVPEKQADQVGGYQLTLGRIIINQNETTLVSDYIPPCTSVLSHQRLIDLHTQIDQFFGQLELYAVQISQKINRKNQTNDLAMMMLNVSDKVITHLGQNINNLRWHSLYESPSHMFDKVISLGRILRNYIDSKSGAGKEDLLNYFAEWCGLTQGDFDVLFAELVNVGYNHAQIDKTVVKVQRFMKVMEELFATLNRLDYIGKRRDTGIFVAERLEGTGSGLGSSKRSTSFLAD